jgi:hypothetical protein
VEQRAADPRSGLRSASSGSWLSSLIAPKTDAFASLGQRLGAKMTTSSSYWLGTSVPSRCDESTPRLWPALAGLAPWHLPMNRWNFLGRATSPRAPCFRIGALGDRALPNPSWFMVRVQFRKELGDSQQPSEPSIPRCSATRATCLGPFPTQVGPVALRPGDPIRVRRFTSRIQRLCITQNNSLGFDAPGGPRLPAGLPLRRRHGVVVAPVRFRVFVPGDPLQSSH